MSRAFSIVDAHVHFWNPQRLNYPWLAGLPALNRAFFPEDYFAATETANIGKMLFVEGGCEPAQNRDEVKWIGELAAREPRLKGIVAHAPLERGGSVRDELDALAQFALVRGVRRNLQGEADTDFCLQPGFIAGVRALPEFNFTFDLCVRHEQLRAVTELVRRVPEVPFILDHFGKPPVRDGKIEPWATELKALAKLPNVNCKISGLATEADWRNWKTADFEPYFDLALEAFGFDRVLFGGDWPVCTLATDYQHWLDTVRELTADASDEDLKKLFQTNAERIYRV